jgi:dTDP-4-amino-4,6-dideoxygalactose transaminase
MIVFNRAPVVGCEMDYIRQAIESRALCGDGSFSKKSEDILRETLQVEDVLLTPSCTAALEMAAILINLKDGDEVIMPSYTFVSTANAFALRGATIVFADIEPETMNLSVTSVEKAITSKTRAIVPVHYAGVACDMDGIMALAHKFDLYVIEDAAQAIGSYYNGNALGTIGHFGTISFHETKNITSGGEGGALLINDKSMIERASIVREKGTNRSQFFRGEVDKYSWVDIGSSYLPSEIQGAYLYGQLLHLSEINADRLATWKCYYRELEVLLSQGLIELPYIPNYASNNAHMFYLKCKDISQRTALIGHLKQLDISAVFHYVPLHSSTAGLKFGRFDGVDRYTTSHSERLVRLPIYYGLEKQDAIAIASAVRGFFMPEN